MYSLILIMLSPQQNTFEVTVTDWRCCAALLLLLLLLRGIIYYLPCCTSAQVLPKEPAPITLLHGSGHGLRAGPAVLIPPLRGRQLAADLPLVEREWFHALGALRCGYVFF